MRCVLKELPDKSRKGIPRKELQGWSPSVGEGTAYGGPDHSRDGSIGGAKMKQERP